MGCEGYSAIARVYDRLNAELDYVAWADFVETCMDRFLPARPTLVLDLACGTGSMTLELARRGYDMIGVDGSAEMLAEAFNRAKGDPHILWLLQDMRTFELYGTVGAVTCCLDSLNYLLSEEDLAACLSTVHNYLDPDGLFLFDMNTPKKFETVYSDNSYILEDELVWDKGTDDEERAQIYCGWQNYYDKESALCDFDLTLFEELPNGTYRREEEHQRERAYSLETVEHLLRSSGFEVLGVYSDYAFTAADGETLRWYIAARAKK